MMASGILSERVLWVLLAQGTACLAAGLAGSYLLRPRAARAHQVLVTGLVAAVLMPAAYLVVRHFGLGLLAPRAVALPDAGQVIAKPALRSGLRLPPVVPEPVDDAVTEGTSAVEADAEMTVTGAADLAAFAPDYETEAPKLPWAAIGLIGWAAVTTLLLGRLALRFVLGLRLLRRARPVGAPSLREALQIAKDRVGVTGPVELRRSESIRSPIIWCWRRVPVLLVHGHSQNTRARDWVGVFCHELAHRKRLDHVSGLLAEVLAAVWPWHPLAWWARERLSRLSEEACDDWVVAGGQIGVDYAESLLDLAPQSQPAFLPTVVGKEPVMKKRICRIVRDRCGNPTVGKSWTLGVSVLVIGIAAGVAFAQPGPLRRAGGPQHDEPMIQQDQRPPRERALAIEGRRNVLERMLDQLRDQARETEAALREQGDRPSERREILRAELVALRNQIALTERQLANLGRPGGDRPAQPARPMVERARRANERLVDLQARAEQTHHELQTIDDADSPEAQELRESLKVIEREIRDTEVRLDRASAARAEAAEAETRAREAQQLARRRAAAARETAESARRMRLDRLGAEAREMALRLRELAEQGRAESEEAQALRDDLRIMRDELRPVRQVPPEPAQPRARATAQAPRRARIARAQDGLFAQIEMAEQRLHEAEEAGDEPRAERLRRLLEQLHQRQEALDHQERDAGMDRPVEPDIAGQVLELRGQVNGLNEQMQEMQNLLRRLLAERQRSDPAQN